MGNHVKEICSKSSSGTYPLGYTGSVTFKSIVLGAVLGTGTISDKGTGTLTEDTGKCKSSCKQYSIEVDWKYFDNIDANSFTELSKKGYFKDESGIITKLMGVLEGTADLALDKILSADFNVISTWKKSETGCCKSKQ